MDSTRVVGVVHTVRLCHPPPSLHTHTHTLDHFFLKTGVNVLVMREGGGGAAWMSGDTGGGRRVLWDAWMSYSSTTQVVLNYTILLRSCRMVKIET
jgi:hypothetical protein